MPTFEAELSDGRVVELESDQQPTEEQVIQALKAQEPKPLPQTSAFGAFARQFAKGIIPAFAARTGGKLGEVLGIESGPGALATGFAGALTASVAASKIQDAVVNAALPGAKSYEEADATQHPLASMLGGFASGATAFKVQPLKGAASLPAFLRGTATPAQRAAALGLGAATGMGAAAGVVSPLIEGHAPTVSGVLESAAMGLTFGQPRGGKLAAINRGRNILPTAAAEAAKNNTVDTALASQEAQEASDGVNTPAKGETAQGGAAAGAGDTAKAPATPSLTAEEQAYLDTEREGLGTSVEVIPEETDPNSPFARNRKRGQFMGINRQKGTIEVYPEEFSRWLKDIPADRRAEAVRSRLAEEDIHLKTPESAARRYWNALTAVEKAIETKLYTGKWRGKGTFSLDETDMGYEAIRRRMQQLARMPTSEVAEAARVNRWGLQSLEAVNNTVRGIRERLGTRASDLQGRILDRVQANVDAAKGALTGAAPAAIRKGAADEFKDGPGFYLPDLAPGEGRPKDAPINIPEEARRLKISPVEIDWDQPGKEGAYRPISDAEAANPEELGRVLTADARIQGSSLPVSSSRRLVVLADKATGQVHLVSVYPHGRTGAMVTDPRKAGLAKPNVPLGSILDRYKPLYSVLRDSPVKNFHQAFDGMDDYQGRFGEEAGQRSQESLGKAAVAGSRSSYEQSVDAVYPGEGEQPNAPTDADLKAFHDFFEGEVPATKNDFDRMMGNAAAKASRQMSNAVHQAFLAEQEANPKASPEANMESALSKLYADLQTSPTRSHFIEAAQARFGGKGLAGEAQEGWATPPKGQVASNPQDLTLPRFARKSVPAGTVEPAPPGKAAAPKTLTPEEAAAIKARAAGQFPPRWGKTLYRQLAERQVPKERYTMGKDTPLPREEEAPAKPQPQLPGHWPEEAGPAAINKAVADDIKAAASSFASAIANRHSADLVARAFDDSSNQPHNIARRIEQGIRLQSAEYKGVRGALHKIAAEIPGDKQVLAAANAVVQSGFDKYKLGLFQQQVAQGKARAAALMNSASFRQRRIGRVWDRAADQLKAELDYAQANWSRPEVQNTARKMKDALDGIHAQLIAAGIDVAKDPNYLPGRYDMSMWDGRHAMFAMPRIWGTKWREPKHFADYYQAIAAGPYVAATRDGASLVNHAYRKGLEMIYRQQWLDGLKATLGPSGKPLAKDVIRRPSGTHVSPDPSYIPVNVGGKFIAVDEDFAPLIRNLTGRSAIEDTTFTRHLLHAEQFLKHNLLIGDFFHLGRMVYYGTSILGKQPGFKRGWTALDIATQDVPEAVRRGAITQAEADWGNEQVSFAGRNLSRRDLLAQAQQGAVGFNVGRIQDALYKDVFTQLTPTAGPIRRAVATVADPTTGRYNRFLFDQFTRGLMSESLVHEFERQSPKVDPAKHLDLLRDISRDLNNYYGNIGRQGLIQNRTMQDLSRMLLLAPQWVEGLAKKELVGYSRLSGLSSAVGTRKGLTATGTTGSAIGKGLVFMFGLTQAINLITRGKATWENEEKGHKLDAWIPAGGGRKEGFWLSPLAVFNELTHDVWRLTATKPKVMDAIDTIIGNKESPILRAALIAATGQAPGGEYQTTSMGQLDRARQALMPVPITFGKYLQAGGHAIAPKLVRAPYPGAMMRQGFSTLGLKVEPQQSILSEVTGQAKDFVKQSGIDKTTGWRQEPTDEPGYSKLRQYLRAGDDEGAAKMLEALRKGRTDQEIVKSMKLSAKRPFTGNAKAERQFIASLDDAGLERYTQAQARRQEELQQFLDFYLKQP